MNDTPQVRVMERLAHLDGIHSGLAWIERVTAAQFVA